MIVLAISDSGYVGCFFAAVAILWVIGWICMTVDEWFTEGRRPWERRS